MYQQKCKHSTVLSAIHVYSLFKKKTCTPMLRPHYIPAVHLQYTQAHTDSCLPWPALYCTKWGHSVHSFVHSFIHSSEDSRTWNLLGGRIMHVQVCMWAQAQRHGCIHYTSTPQQPDCGGFQSQHADRLHGFVIAVVLCKLHLSVHVHCILHW